jgi:TP901 family phage tail tape measure protein
MDYTILLNTQLNTETIQTQLDALASFYHIDVSANIDTGQIGTLQSQISNVQSEISSQAKTTLLIDPAANNEVLQEIRAQAEAVQAQMGADPTKTIASQTSIDGVLKAASIQKTYTDEIGKTTVATTQFKAATDKTEESLKTTVRTTDDTSKATVTLGDTWLGTMGNVIARTIQWSLALGLVYGSLRALQDGVKYVIDLNTAMTTTQMITGKTSEQIQGLYQNYQQLAQQLGVTTLEVGQASDGWLRQGKSAEDAAKLTTASVMLSKLAVTDTATATQSLTAILNGFGMSADDATSVMDKMVALSNSAKTSAAVSFETLSSAMQVSAAIAKDTGVTYDQLNSYIATIATVTQQSGDTIGNSLKTMFAHMENIKSGATEDGVSINLVDKSLQAVGISLRNTDGSFVDLGTIIDELGTKWQTLDGFHQKQIATQIAGVRQVNAFMALMDNFNKTLEYQGAQLNTNGLITDRYATYLESVAASAEKMKSAWQDAWAKTINPQVPKFFYDFGTIIAETINKAGGFVPVILAVVAALVALNGPLVIGAIGAFQTQIASITAGLTAEATAAETAAAANAAVFGIIGVAVAAAIITFNLFRSNIKSVDDQLKDLQTSIQSLTSDLNSLTGTQTQISGLWKELDTLRTKQKLSDDQLQRSTELQNQIKQIMPEVAGSYDQYGNFILDASVNLGALITLQQKKIELDQQELNQKLSDEIKLEAQQYLDATKQLQSLIDKQKEHISEGQKGRGGTPIATDADIQKQKEATDEYINQLEQMYVKANETTKTDIINYLNSQGDAGKYAAQQLEALNNAQKDVTKSAQEASQASTVSAADSQKAFDEILKDAVALIKQQKQEEISSLQDQLSAYKDTIDAEKQADQDQYDARMKELEAEKEQLQDQQTAAKAAEEAEKQTIQDQLNGYTALIDAQEKLLAAQKAQNDYQNTRADKQHTEATLEAQIAALSLDNSAEGIAKRKKLEDELAKLKEGMAQDAANNEYDLQKQALDQEKQTAKDEADIRLRALQDEINQADQEYQLKLKEIQNAEQQAKQDYDTKTKELDDEYKAKQKALDDQIKQIQDYLSQQGTIENDARKMMADKNSGLYQELIDWNKKYGDGLNETIVTAWQNATQALDAYRASLNSLPGAPDITPATGNTSPQVVHAHHSGLASGFVNGSLGDGEQFAKLMKGEIVLNTDDMNHFMKNILPQIPSVISTGGGVNFDHIMELTIQGNADAETVQDIDDIANKVTNKLIKAFGNRGMIRQANATSI